MLNFRKKHSADLRKYYTLFLEIGVITVLLVFIMAMSLDITSEKQIVDFSDQPEVVVVENIPQTVHKKPPPPPAPPVPVAVPDDRVIKDEILDIAIEFDPHSKLTLPPQSKKEKEETFFRRVQQMPKMVGGQEWLYGQIEYPERARRAGIEGRVIIQFIVTQKGEVENAKVIRGIGGGCDNAALEVIKKARFTIGRQRGRAVRVKMTQTIFFRLQE